MHIKGYRLVVEVNLHKFHLRITDLIREGWELHGPTQVIHQLTENRHFIEPFQKLDIYYYQALVLLKPENTPMLDVRPKP